MRLMIQMDKLRDMKGVRKSTLLPKFIYIPERFVIHTVRSITEHTGLPDMEKGWNWWKIPVMLSFLMELIREIIHTYHRGHVEFKLGWFGWTLIAIIVIKSIWGGGGESEE